MLPKEDGVKVLTVGIDVRTIKGKMLVEPRRAS